MKVTKLAQSTFIVENKSGKRLVIDPGKYNYSDNFTTKDLGVIDLMFITHKHADHHFPKAEQEIIDLHKPFVITNEEIGNMEFPKKNNYAVHKVGDVIEKFGFKVVLVETDHFAKCEDVTNFGLYIEADNQSFYHTSDTRFMEQCYYNHELVANCDILCVPISNRGVVMGIDDSLVFTSQVKPKIVVPMHYDSPKDKVRVLPDDFINRYKVLKDKIDALKAVKPVVLNFNQMIDLDKIL